MTESQRHQLLTEWNNTATAFPHNQCIHHPFEAQVACTPDAWAVVFGNQRLTYRQLNQRANQLAHYLKKLGVKPEVLVTLCATPLLVCQNREAHEHLIFHTLKEVLHTRSKARILERLKRLSSGHFGDCKRLDTRLGELRFKFGSGYRVYYSEIDDRLVLLLCGGDKSTPTKDLETAKTYLKIYQENRS